MNLKEGALLRNNTYRIERVLGQGGFGITYLATHVRLKKRVAIKEFFPKAFCDRYADTSHVRTASKANSVTVEKLKNKFIKEAEHIAEMDSPFIVRIIDVFEENHTAYYIMDYIEGRSLSDIVKSNGPLPVDQAVEYITKIGEALTYIHSKRINHLDVKPANIMVRSKDNTPILIDFGLSKQYDSDGNQTSTTPVGISHGYAPMEQYNDGGVKEFSPQTDLYSLAATLYYSLTGAVPPHASKLIDETLIFPDYIPFVISNTISIAMSPTRRKRHESISEFINHLSNIDTSENGTLDDTKIDESLFDDTSKTTIENNRTEKLCSKPESRPAKKNRIIAFLFTDSPFWRWVSISVAVVGLVWGLIETNNKNKAPIVEESDKETIIAEMPNEILESSPESYSGGFFNNESNKSSEPSLTKYQKTSSGLKYVTLKEGTGKHPNENDVVTVHYRGRLLDGTVFDSTYDRGEPASFPLSAVILGWTEGVQLMREGGSSVLYIPSDLAYGNAGAGDAIPPNAPLIFEIELLKVGE